MGGEQNGGALGRQLPEDVLQLRPGYGVQSAGGFVQNQKLCTMGKGQSQLEFHLHALGELPQLFAGAQMKNLQIVGEGFFIPPGVEAFGHCGNLRNGLPGVKGGTPCGVANAGADIGFVNVLSQNMHAAAIRVDKPEDGFHGCGFSGTVPAEKTHNMPFFQRKRDVFQRKAGIAPA